MRHEICMVFKAHVLPNLYLTFLEERKQCRRALVYTATHPKRPGHAICTQPYHNEKSTCLVGISDVELTIALDTSMGL